MSVTSSSTVVGVFGNRAVAEQAMEALSGAGFEREEMHYLVPGSSGGFFEELKSFFTGNNPAPAPGSDDLINSFTQMGLSNEVAQYYSQLYNQGHAILAVKTSGDEQMALNILQHYGASNLGSGSVPMVKDDVHPMTDEHNLQPVASHEDPAYVANTPASMQEQYPVPVGENEVSPVVSESSQQVTAENPAYVANTPAYMQEQYPAPVGENEVSPMVSESSQQVTAENPAYVANTPASMQDQYPAPVGENEVSPVVSESSQQVTAENPAYVANTPASMQEQTPTSEYDTAPSNAQLNTNFNQVETPDYGANYQGDEDTQDRDEAREMDIPTGFTGQQATEADEITTPGYQANTGAEQNDDMSADHTSKLQQLREQIQTTRQQLQETKDRLDTVKKRESEFQLAQREFQELQTELQATRAELQDAEKRVDQYQV